MKHFLLLLACLALNFVTAQETCGSDAIHANLLNTDAAYAKRVADFDSKYITKKSQNKLLPNTDTNSNVYVIPVVVHIFHKGEAIGEGTNLSDEEVRNQIAETNARFRKIAGSVGDGSGVDTHIQLALATRDENGQCTTGIDRIDLSGNAAYMQHGVDYGATGGITQADVIAHRWNATQYYNIYSISEFDSGANPVAGFALFATSHGSVSDGTTLLSSELKNRFATTLVHETGHAFNLYHTFEGATSTTCPPQTNGCGSGLGDCCADTPPQKNGDYCTMGGGNTCDGENTDLTYASNYMCYGDVTCHSMFTANQAERMADAITSLRGSFLFSNGNMSLVSPATPQIDFDLANGGIACGGGVRLMDTSACSTNTFIYNSVMPGTTFLWTISNGTNTYTSTYQNPEFSAAQGTYNVSLTITNPQGSTTLTKNNFLIISDAEPVTFCQPTATYPAFPFELTVSNVTFNTINRTTDSHVGGPYINFMCSDNTIVTAGQTYQLHVTTKAYPQDRITFAVLIDFNNNHIVDEAEMIYYGQNNGNYEQTFDIDVAIPATAVTGVLLPMRICGNGSQQTLTWEQITCQENLLIGDVEDYGVYITSALGNEAFTRNSLVVSPNPANDILNISSGTAIDMVTVYNMLGQLVASQSINAATGTIDISKLSSGTYLVSAASSGSVLQQKVIKK